MRRGKRKERKVSFSVAEKIGAAASGVLLLVAIFLSYRSVPKPLPASSRALWSAISKQGSAQGIVSPELRSLLGREIDLAGFVIPDDASTMDEMSEFLITPVAAGCIHVPPPPPNYVIHVSMAAGLKTRTQTGAVSVHGQLAVTGQPGGGPGYYVEMTAEKVEAL